MGPTIIPREGYQAILQPFELKGLKEEGGFLKGDCSRFISFLNQSDQELYLGIDYPLNMRALVMEPDQYIVMHGKTCIVNLIEGSDSNEVMLGSSVLRAMSVIIDTTGGKSLYKFAPTQRANLLA
uniref:AlNc14C173G8068 protein n=1 Tax=Albugo laibachii Nc14 TaxID=890382 RepID=F0WNP7_9STRA|nr:AlNc14C173G8068 [Albugo laibachii Nc14]|eukprot:CCA22938.1 AlNc14C173G8068 [Albugo laibachii Nc14]